MHYKYENLIILNSKCGKSFEITSRLIKEMTRVLKVGGCLFIISHGSPEKRKELFRQSVDIKKCDFLFSKQDLAPMSQLINIFRSKLKDKPLSHILKDKALLMESLAESNNILNHSFISEKAIKRVLTKITPGQKERN